MATLGRNLDNSRAAYEMETKASQKALDGRIESQWKRPEFSMASVVSSGIQGAATGASIGSSLKIGQSNGS
jgi:hypothetical protein